MTKKIANFDLNPTLWGGFFRENFLKTININSRGHSSNLEHIKDIEQKNAFKMLA